GKEPRRSAASFFDPRGRRPPRTPVLAWTSFGRGLGMLASLIMAPRTILHVDMDAFYAAVEQRDRPELRGKPVIVGADPKGGRGRGGVSTASYEARRFGVASAMPISEAWRRCPKGVYLHPDMERYARESARIMAVLERFSARVAPGSTH